MNIHFLRAFARKIATKGRIAASDVAELRNHASEDDEADGMAVAAALFAIDSAARDKVGDWTVFFVDALVDLLVWGERPTGTVSRQTADWLFARMTLDGGRVAGAHHALLAALVREAHSCDPRIAALAFGDGQEKAPRAQVALTLGWLDASGVSI